MPGQRAACSRQNLTTFDSNQGNWKRRFAPALGAGVWEGVTFCQDIGILHLGGLLLPVVGESQGQNMALTVLSVPSSLNGTPVLAEALRVFGGGGGHFLPGQRAFASSRPPAPGRRRRALGTHPPPGSASRYTL